LQLHDKVRHQLFNGDQAGEYPSSPLSTFKASSSDTAREKAAAEAEQEKAATVPSNGNGSTNGASRNGASLPGSADALASGVESP
jgi:hypothetical protein